MDIDCHLDRLNHTEAKVLGLSGPGKGFLGMHHKIVQRGFM